MRVQVLGKQTLALVFGIFIGLCLSIVLFTDSEKSYKSVSNFWKDVKGDAAKNKTEELETEELYDESLANKLFEDVRVLCWIMTTPENHKTKAIHIKKTWGRRCNKLLFMSSKADADLGAVALPVGEGRDNLWDKTKSAFQYVYQNHFDEADWFLKADDDK